MYKIHQKGLPMQQLIDLLNSIKLPIEIPLLLHSPVVHFAIAIPVIALLLEITNIFIKRRCVGVISSLLLLLAVIVYFAAFFTGKTDGSEAKSLLSADGKEELEAHKLLGTYLVLGVSVLFILKLIFAAMSSRAAKIIFTLILAAFVGFALKQGKDGGELVFKYGANVQAVSAMDDKIMELEEELDSCKNELETCKTKKQEPTVVTPQATQSSAPQTSSSSEEAASSEASQESEEEVEVSVSSITTTSQESSQEVSSSSNSEATIQEEVLEQIKGAASGAAQKVENAIHQKSEETHAPSTEEPQTPHE